MSNRSSNLCCIIWTRPYGIFEDFKFVHSRAVMDFKKIISINAEIASLIYGLILHEGTPNLPNQTMYRAGQKTKVIPRKNPISLEL